MLVAIVLQENHLRKAVREFKRQYPKHAAAYPKEIKHATRLVRTGKVFPHERIEHAYFVQDRTDPEPMLVINQRCDGCGDRVVCAHRLAVNIAYLGRQIEHVAANEAALEQNEVHELLAEEASEVQP